MIELMYGATNFSRVADKEIREGRPVAIRVTGWRKAFIYRTLALYTEFDRKAGSMPKKTSLGLALRIMLTPSLMGLCHQARSSGMGIVNVRWVTPIRGTSSRRSRLMAGWSLPSRDACGAASQAPSSRLRHDQAI